jgi:hypothetical protein
VNNLWSGIVPDDLGIQDDAPFECSAMLLEGVDYCRCPVPLPKKNTLWEKAARTDLATPRKRERTDKQDSQKNYDIATQLRGLFQCTGGLN